jgi:hypothetical protein
MNEPKQGDDLLLFICNFDLKYSIGRVQENQEGLKMNGTHELLAYASSADVLDKKINTIKKT